MTDEFERVLRERAAAVPDVVAVPPERVWSEVRRRRRARRTRTVAVAGAALAAVVVTGIVTWPTGTDTVTATTVQDEAAPAESAAEAQDEAPVEDQAEEAAEQAAEEPQATTAGGPSADTPVLGSTDGRLSDAGTAPSAGCARPDAAGTVASRIVLAAVAAELDEILDLGPGDVRVCHHPLVVEVRTDGPLPPAVDAVEAVVDDAARLGVAVTWIGPDGAAVSGTPEEGG